MELVANSAGRQIACIGCFECSLMPPLLDVNVPLIVGADRNMYMIVSHVYTCFSIAFWLKARGGKSVASVVGTN